MNLIERVKNILITPKTEWLVIDTETATPMSLLTGYVLPLAVVGSIGGILSYFLFSGTLGIAGFGMKFMIASAIVGIIVSLVVFYVTTLIVDMLAPSFGSEKNLGKSAQLVAYAGTAFAIAGLLSFIPVIGWILPFVGWAYGVYIMYLGIGTIKKTPEDKKVVYILVIYVILIAIYFILTAILGAILFVTLGGIASAGLRSGY